MNDFLERLLIPLSTGNWPASPDQFRALLKAQGFAVDHTKNTHQHWSCGELHATVCDAPEESACFLEAFIDVRAVPEDDVEAYEAAHDEMAGRYASLVKQASKALGEPAFEGDFDEEGFPEDQDAVRLAAWRRERTACYLQFRDDGPDFPLRIELVLDVLHDA